MGALSQYLARVSCSGRGRKSPSIFVQVIDDDDELISKAHKDLSNYRYTKREAEILVHGVNDVNGLRTGCLRPEIRGMVSFVLVEICCVSHPEK